MISLWTQFYWNEPYTFTLTLFERSLAISLLVAFVSFYIQWPGLIGERGLAPAAELMRRAKKRGWTWREKWKLLPTLCWYSSSDAFLSLLQQIGIVCSILAFLGILCGPMLLLACACYMSIKNVGSVFQGLQMHTHLVEITLLYVASSPFFYSAPHVMVLLINTLNWRVMFGGGMGKWYGGDKSWRDGSAMMYHYWTQPLPNPLSPFMHRLPYSLHRLETYMTFVHESIAALFVFAPQLLRLVAFGLFVSLMTVINLSGNFGQIGLLTINESWVLLNDDVWYTIYYYMAYLPGFELWVRFCFSCRDSSALYAPSRLLQTDNIYFLTLQNLLAYTCLVCPYMLTQLLPTLSTFKGHNVLAPFPRLCVLYARFISSSLYQHHIGPRWRWLWAKLEDLYLHGRTVDLFGSYVKFGHMTKQRLEIIIEASADGVEWKEYIFKYKPSAVDRPLPFIPGHMPALDWRLWFLPLEALRGSQPPMWYLRLLLRLLECDEAIMALLHHCPFDASNPPLFIRSWLYDYRFAHGYDIHERQLIARMKSLGVRDALIVDMPDDEPQQKERSQRRTGRPKRQRMHDNIHDDDHSDSASDSSSSSSSEQDKPAAASTQTPASGASSSSSSSSSASPSKAAVSPTAVWVRHRRISAYGPTLKMTGEDRVRLREEFERQRVRERDMAANGARVNPEGGQPAEAWEEFMD